MASLSGHEGPVSGINCHHTDAGHPTSRRDEMQ
jgi:hypothetical protein